MLKKIGIGVALVSLALAAACGGPAAPAAVPTVPPLAAPTLAAIPTLVAPTAEVIPTLAPPPTTAPTTAATAAPPTTAPETTQLPAATTAATAAAPAGGAGSSFAEALKNSQSTKVYRMELSLKASGDLANLGGSSTPSTEELTLLTMKGAINDQDSDLTLGGIFAQLITGFLGFDGTEDVRMVTVGKQGYINGKLSGTTEAKWYVLPGDQNSVQTPVDPQKILESFSKSNLGADEFTKTGTETLDNVQCDVYSGTREAVVKAFQDVGGNQTPVDASTVDAADMKFYLCSDKFLHQITMNVAVHDKAKPDQKGTFALFMHLFDINGNIKIEAPANAEPIKIPGFDLATPSPTPAP